MNTIGIIVPYKYEGMWVFDDPAIGLHREPFVAGIDTMIDQLVASIPNANKGYGRDHSFGNDVIAQRILHKARREARAYPQ
jgi:hypothetical protein